MWCCSRPMHLMHLIHPICCSVLQCVAVCCSVLQCVAACCSVLQCVAVCCSVHLMPLTYPDSCTYDDCYHVQRLPTCPLDSVLFPHPVSHVPTHSHIKARYLRAHDSEDRCIWRSWSARHLCRHAKCVVPSHLVPFHTRVPERQRSHILKSATS